MACPKHKVPLPGRGYWARIAAGQDVSKTCLPPITNKLLETITFSGALQGALHIKPSEIPEVQKERSSEKQIIVADEPADLHALVRRTLILLSRAKPNEKGMLLPQDDAVGLYVSPDELGRGIAILDALIKGLISRGSAVSVGPAVHHLHAIHIGNEFRSGSLLLERK
jgi:hypothetical protein